MDYKMLINNIKKDQIQGLYLFFGEETYLIEKTLEQLKEKIVDPQFEQLNFSIFDGRDNTVEQLIDSCETLPFMAEKKLVFAKNYDAFQNKRKNMTENEEEELMMYLGRLPSTTCLVFYGSINIDNRKKIVKEVQKKGNVVEFAKLKEENFKKWIMESFKRQGKEIEAKELHLFMANVDYIGKNATQGLFDIENEINKIVAFMGREKQVGASHIETVVSSTFQNDIFKLMDAIQNKNGKEALRRFNYMLVEGEPPLKILTTLGNQIKNVLGAKLLLEEGYSSKMIASKLGIHPFVASKCATQSKSFDVNTLKRLLNFFLEADLMIKTGKINERIAIEFLIVEMCR